MAKRGKKYTEAAKKIEPGKRYPVREAMDLVVATAQGEI